MRNQKTKKKCSVEGCDGMLFGRGYCRFHYGTEYLLKTGKGKIPRRSKKRQKQERQYITKRADFIQAERDQHPRGELYCIFCDCLIQGEPDLHHGLGRDDDLILDEAFWFVAHRLCHVIQYHGMSCQDIEWWEEYLRRMQKINPIIYRKELMRTEKSNV